MFFLDTLLFSDNQGAVELLAVRGCLGNEVSLIGCFNFASLAISNKLPGQNCEGKWFHCISIAHFKMQDFNQPRSSYYSEVEYLESGSMASPYLRIEFVDFGTSHRNMSLQPARIPKVVLLFPGLAGWRGGSPRTPVILPCCSQGVWVGPWDISRLTRLTIYNTNFIIDELVVMINAAIDISYHWSRRFFIAALERLILEVFLLLRL